MFKVLAAMACVVAIGSVPAQAASYLFSARIDQANALLPVGTIINGGFSYDDGLPASVLYPVEQGQTAGYVHPSILLSAVIGGIAYSSRADAFVANDAGSDGDGFGLTGLTSTFVLQFGYEDPSGAVFSGVGLPTGPLPVLATDPRSDADDDDDLTVSSGYFSFVDLTRGQSLDATVLSITPSAAAVPEASTWVMLITGFGLVGGLLRRRGRVLAG